MTRAFRLLHTTLATLYGIACPGRVAIRASVIALLVIASAPAMASPTDLSIAWQAPTSCPDAESVRLRIEQRLGRSLDDVLVGITVAVSPDRGRFVARIDLRAVTVANDVRTLTSTRCDELADAVAVIIARVASEADAAKRVAAAEVDHDAGTIAAVAPTPAAHHLWSFGARLSAISGIGVVPEVGVGGEIAGYVQRHSANFELARTRWVSRTQVLHTDAPAGVKIGLDVTSVRFGWRSEELPLRAWLAVDVGSMSGSGVGLSNPQLGAGRWVSAGAGFGVAWPMAKWTRLVGTTEVLAAFERVRFRLDDGLIVYQPAPMAARATVGLEVGWR
ncbi:MAG: hypothetical protein JWO36_4220 [Myxococcales bacterium]|nr:hypothetical protein [Myxococcales bacterium]